MSERLEVNLAGLSLARLTEPGAVIIQALEAGEGVRLGQCAVLSTKVHAFNARSPEHVQVMVNADAGQVFYHRRDSGAICHLDIFHQCGMIDHVLAASYVCQAVDFYHKLAGAKAPSSPAGLVNPDLIDIQTAAGGGRITGTLTGGQKESLCRVHENHVHLALHLPYDHICCLFFIVAAIETAILACGFELRCNEQITCIYSADTQADLSPYTGQTDSQLTGQQEEAQTCSRGGEAVNGKQAGTAGAIGCGSAHHQRHLPGGLISGADRARAIALDGAAAVTATACQLAEQHGSLLRIRPADLQFAVWRPCFSDNVCLLTDSSGSMAGSKPAAAEYLAGEILRGGCNRASVITFQANWAEVIKPFAASRQAVLLAFDSIAPYGVAPLALGLRYSRGYCQEKQLERPLLVLITAGISGRSYEEAANPLLEALTAAIEVKQYSHSFLCIGLADDAGFLKKLAVAAGGVLYLFTEFEHQLML